MNLVALALAVSPLLPSALPGGDVDEGCETKYQGSTCQPVCVASGYCSAPSYCQLVLRSTLYGLAANCDCIGTSPDNVEFCCDLYVLPGGEDGPQFVAIGECPAFHVPLPPLPGSDEEQEESYYSCGFDPNVPMKCLVYRDGDFTRADCYQVNPQGNW